MQADDQAAPATRRVSGSPTFVAATRLDENHDELSFSDAVTLARLVLEHDGGPVPARGKRALMDGATLKRLTKLGLLRLDEGFGRDVGTTSKSGWRVAASDEGFALVTGCLAQTQSPEKQGSDARDSEPAQMEEPGGATHDDTRTGAMPDRVENAAVDLWWVAGFSPESRREWTTALPELGEPIDSEIADEDRVRVASRWRVGGFTVKESRCWHDAFAHRQDWELLAPTAREWRDAGFLPEEAGAWSRGWPMPEESVEYAGLFRDAGWHPFHVWLLYSFSTDSYGVDWGNVRRRWAPIPWSHALACARAGMSPEEALDSLELHPTELERRLRDRFTGRTPVDPFVAMHVNHHIWLSYGTEIPPDAPFWAERLWDLHDEEDDCDRREGRVPTNGGPHAQHPLGTNGPGTKKSVAPTPCPGSGQKGRMVERDGWDEWYVVCPTCETTWVGGPTAPLPDHDSR